MKIVFTSEASIRKADEIVDYLRGPRLWRLDEHYPDSDRWLQKVHAQLKEEQKRALVALVGNKVVGAVIYQRHLEHADALEIKNITVRPDQQGRHIADFLLKNAEVEGAKDFGSAYALADAKARNVAIKTFLRRQRYRPIAETDLYGLGAGTDVVFRKDLSSRII